MQGFFGGGSSMSTVSREDNAAMSSEDSSCPDESELELGLGLSLGCVFHKGQQQSIKGHYSRFLTAMDLPSGIYAPSSTSSSSSTLSRSNGNAGTKRSADSVSAPNGASSQVVGWPPVGAYRMNSMVNQAKSLATEDFNSIVGKKKCNDTVLEHAKNGRTMKHCDSKTRTSPFVKVNMDGIAIGRKVDLSAHGSYEKLAQTLEDMFLRPTTTINTIRSSAPANVTKRPKLLDVSSDFVVTYEDKEGDWMLVGDVPWGMFLCTVKRLRIMRTSEANGLAPRSEDTDGRLRRKPMPI